MIAIILNLLALAGILILGGFCLIMALTLLAIVIGLVWAGVVAWRELRHG